MSETVFSPDRTLPALSLATPDNITIVGHGTHDGPLRCIGVGSPTSGPAALVASTAMPGGTVIAPGPAPGQAQPALADGSALGNSIGIVTTPTGVAEAAIIEYGLIAGFLSLLSGVWDAVTGQSGGLTDGDVYYLSQATPGALTNVKPVSGQVVQIGTAISTTTMVLAGAQAAPVAPTGSVEHKNLPSGGTVAATPGVTTTFVDNGAHGAVTLADGTIDGFQKTIALTFLTDGDVTISGPNLQSYTIGAGKVGGLTVAWDDVTTHSWLPISLVNAAPT